MSRQQYYIIAASIAILCIIVTLVSMRIWLHPAIVVSQNSASQREAFAEMAYPWMQVDTLEDIRSLYHKILVIDTKRKDLGKCLLLNDEVQFCDQEERKYHELIVHFSAQYLPDAHPTNVLLIGGGDTMVLREVLKYGPLIKSITILELDDMVTRVCEKHFGADRASKDDRVKWIYGNVPVSVKKLLNQEPRPVYDMIVVDTTESLDHNIDIDSRPFFQDVTRLLSPSGVLVKNGDQCESIMKSIFPHTLVYGFDSKTYDARYQFMLGSSIDFRSTIVTTGTWFKHNVHTVYYNPDLHFTFLRWTDLFRRSAIDRVREPTPSTNVTVLEFDKQEEERKAHERAIAEQAEKKAAREAREAAAKSAHAKPVEVSK